MAMRNDNWWGPLTAVMLTALIGFGAYALYTGKTLNSAELIVGTLVGNLAMLLNFRYGSSKGSKDKDDILNNKP